MGMDGWVDGGVWMDKWGWMDWVDEGGWMGG